MHVLIVDDHAIFRDGLVALLVRERPDLRISQAGCLEDARAIMGAAEGPPDLILLDLFLESAAQHVVPADLISSFSGTPLVVLSGATDAAIVRQAIDAGAMGFIPKTMGYAAFSAALDRALKGEVFLPDWVAGASESRPMPLEDPRLSAIERLTLRQKQILRVVAYGWTNRAIANHLNVSEETVKTYLANIFRELGVRSRTEAVYLLSRASQALSPAA
jgi:DNA-binding NarL/FixJ family response regulator